MESIPADQLGKRLSDAIGGLGPNGVPKDDVAFQPPRDALKGGPVPSIVYRDIPNITTLTSWDVPTVRSALSGLMEGVFDRAGQFADALFADDRVQATMGSRLAGLWGREARHRPANDSSAAREVLDAWVDHWRALEDSYGFDETAAYTILMGFGHGQIVWDTTGKIWKPYPRPWHPRYEFYHWPARRYVAISQDGLLPIVPGDGKWYAAEPYGSYRGWVRGAMRALAEPWLGRRFAIRDWWRFNEVHGIPTRVGYTPAAADPGERAQFEKSLGQLGSETTLLIPRGVDKDLGYEYALVEAADTNWESFERTINQCDLAIVLAIKFQNLTTEITAGGSYAAAREHGKVDVAQIKKDNAVWRCTIHRDFARPFAQFNFGDADLAPITDRDVPDPPREDYSAAAEQFAKLGTAMQAMAAAGVKFSDASKLRSFAEKRLGLVDVPEFLVGDPPAVTTAKASMVTAHASKTTAEKPEPEPKAPEPKEAA